MSRSGVIAVVCAACLASATVGYAASFTLTTAKIATGTVTTPVMFPDSITIQNKAGGTAGKPENGDIITIVFSQLVNEPSLCSGWANNKTTQSTNLNWAITPGTGGADDVLTDISPAATPCPASGLHLGSIDLGTTGYVVGAGQLQFQNTTTALTINAATTTITLSLNGQKTGAGQPTAGQVTNGGAATFTPDAALTDRSSRNCGSNLSKTSATTLF